MKELVKIYTDLQQKKRDIEKHMKKVKADIIDAAGDKLPEFGTKHINGVKFTIPKKVTWDSKAMDSIVESIKQAGENPSNYFIKTEYKIHESEYKKLPDDVQDYMASARTVKRGTISIEFDDE